ncbi:MAG: glycine/betaine/sarcosine/D-proline family reductase selenoprotein B [Eubacteriales bacterium]|nr:glycine/betaine/sarcosine/D-proline family reductase selenoprotein B [Eubacteriales bacterium]
MDKFKVIIYLNQFYGQIGGEEAAGIGLSYSEEIIGPGLLYQKNLGDEAEIVGTFVCGDNYFAENIEKTLDEILAKVQEVSPDIVFLGPAFNAGRYGISCGNIASAISNQLGIPTVTGMYPENPAADIFRKDTYIVETKISAADMRRVVPKMTSLGLRLLKGEAIGSAATEGYIKRDIILNEQQEQKASTRAIEMAMARLRGEDFVTELSPPVYDVVDSPPPIKDLRNARIALVTDGGLIPEHNPDKLKPNGSETWGQYNIDQLLSDPHFVIHSGYDGTWVLENPQRLVPIDAMRQLEAENVIGEIFPDVFVACGNCASIEASKRIGAEIAQKLRDYNIDGVILTST